MKIKWLHGVIAMVAAFGLTSTVALAVKPDKAPVKVKLEACKKAKDPVPFDHKQHVDAKIECAKCHHTQKDLTATSDVEVPTCSSCHLKPDKPEVGKCNEMSMTKNPYHKQCIECHKASPKKPATKCVDCHKK